MSSSSRPPRSRYRFGFRGKRPGPNAQAATTDEILDSLTRQAKLIEREGRERTLGLQTILEVEPDEELIQSSPPESYQTARHLRNRNLGKSAFAIMLTVGLTFLSIYSKLPQSISPQSLAMLRQTISRAGFTNWNTIALMAFCAFIIALLVRRSTNRTRFRAISTA